MDKTRGRDVAYEGKEGVVAPPPPPPPWQKKEGVQVYEFHNYEKIEWRLKVIYFFIKGRVTDRAGTHLRILAEQHSPALIEIQIGAWLCW